MSKRRLSGAENAFGRSNVLTFDKLAFYLIVWLCFRPRGVNQRNHGLTSGSTKLWRPKGLDIATNVRPFSTTAQAFTFHSERFLDITKAPVMMYEHQKHYLVGSSGEHTTPNLTNVGRNAVSLHLGAG